MTVKRADNDDVDPNAHLDGCEVMAFRNAERELEAVWIELSGSIASFPSTSNSREVGYHWTRTKTGQREKLPYIRKSRSQLARLEAATWHYRAALNRSSEPPALSFGSTRVHVLALLAHRPGRFDSHNMSKPIGDWLEAIGLIENDTNAEIDCRKKSEYKDIGRAELAPIPGRTVHDHVLRDAARQFWAQHTTLLCIQRRGRVVQAINEARDLELLIISTGKRQIIG